MTQVAREWFGAPGQSDGMPAARRRIGRLLRAGLIERRKVLWQVPPLVSCTRAGVALASSTLKPYSLRLFDLQHNLQVVDIASALTRRHPGATWTTERELRAGEFRIGARHSDYLHLPDGVFECPVGHRVAVELDRTPKSSARYGRLVSDYLDAIAIREVNAVVWIVSASALAKRIQAAIADERATDVASVVIWAGGEFKW